MDYGKAKVKESHEDGSIEWHEQRKQGIGGSDAPTVLGLRPYGRTRKDLWAVKTGRQSPFQGSVATDYGSKIEPYVFDEILLRGIESVSGYEQFEYLSEANAALEHPDYEFIQGNVDGLISGEAIVEIKTSVNPPPEYGCKDIHYPQIQQYLAVTGFDHAWYVYFKVPFDRKCALDIERKFVDQTGDFWKYIIGEGEFTVRKIKSDPEYQERLIEAEKDFWTCVINDNLPGEYLTEGEVKVEDDRLAGYLEQYGRAKAKIATVKSGQFYESAKDEKKEAKQKAKKHLQAYDAKKVHLPNGDSATWNSRGYWRLYPEDREIKTNSGDSYDDIDVPF